MPSSTRSLSRAGSTLRSWRPRQWAVALASAAATAVLIGVPTAVIRTPLFTRAVPAQWWNYPVLILSAVLGGLVIATYVRGTPRSVAGKSLARSRMASTGTLMSALAVGCPVCNKAVVALLGVSGALSYWALLQPLIAVLSIALLAEAALRRLSAEAVCPLPQPAA
ncbi:hypothetical protein [Streptomyces olivoreticuli]|uniref:hypothetical protein n=1 Tax=Streptomyces olivoreticuli TaxID=68246 RepID=UPI000E262D7F|nr:hypothetical protein [Streptomyces olivoreticuli]